MPKVIVLPTFCDSRGELIVLEKVLPFEIKRLYYIFNVSNSRGGHRHKLTRQAFICVSGSCEIYLNNGQFEQTIILEKPSHCLIVEPEDWHSMFNFKSGTVLLVLASEFYDKDDYIDEPYN